MDLLTGLVLAAGLGAAYALAAGTMVMARNGAVAHVTSKTWTAWRTGWQAAAVSFILLGLVGNPESTAGSEHDCLYDYRMLSNAECLAYRDRVLATGSSDERVALQDELHRLVDERAQGLPASNWARLRK